MSSEEKDQLRDHAFDGIQEYDNPLPKWWVYLFYFTIIFGTVYFLNLHVFGGKTLADEYNEEIAQHQKVKEEKAKQEKAVQDSSSESSNVVVKVDTGAGQKIYQTSCVACHGMSGEGGIGPNLVDNHWINGDGRDVKVISKIIGEGVSAKGMPAWEAILGMKKINNISAYLKSIQGTSPNNAKAPQGKEYK